MASADIPSVNRQLEEILAIGRGSDPGQRKMGIGIEEILEAIVTRILRHQKPLDETLRALVRFRLRCLSRICYVRVVPAKWKRPKIN